MLLSDQLGGSLPSTLVELLQARAAISPDKVAYSFLEDDGIVSDSLTYAELDRYARVIGQQLIQLNASHERALLLYTSGLDYIVAFFGCLYAGVIAVPAYPPHPRRPMTRIKAILDDARATFALTTSDILSKIDQRLAEEPMMSQLTWLSTDQLYKDATLANSWQAPAFIQPDTLAFLQYTSGSTSTPKGVMVTHSNLLATMADMYRPWGHTAESIMVTWLPIFHDLGLIYGILTPLYGGYRCVLMAPISFLQQPLRWLRAISDLKATHSHAPNFAYELCTQKISDEDRDTLDLSHWQVTLNAAEPVRLDTMRRFAERFAPARFSYDVFCPGFGLAEASLKVSAQPVGRSPLYRRLLVEELEQHRLVDGTAADDAKVVNIVGCGESAIDADIRIVNPQTYVECRPDQVGEIWVSSPSVAQGYWNRPEATSETFQAYIVAGPNVSEGPFMRTGDLGFVWRDELFVTGRIKDLLIIRGRNIYPSDVELVAEQAHPALRSGCTAAFAVMVNQVEQLVVLQEVRRTHMRDLDVDGVLEAVRRAITSEFSIQPHAIVLLRTGSILKTSSGKIQRQGNKQAYLKDALKIVGRWDAPRTEAWANSNAKTADADNHEDRSMPSHTQIANWIAHWLGQKLDVSVMTIQPDVPFADLGLDSVAAVELVEALVDWLPTHIEIDSTLTWNFPTIDDVAQHLSRYSVPEKPSHRSKASSGTLDSDLDGLSEADLIALLAAETNQ